MECHCVHVPPPLYARARCPQYLLEGCDCIGRCGEVRLPLPCPVPPGRYVRGARVAPWPLGVCQEDVGWRWSEQGKEGGRKVRGL